MILRMQVRSEIAMNGLLNESKAQKVLLLGVTGKSKPVGFGQALVYCIYDFIAPNVQLKYQK